MLEMQIATWNLSTLYVQLCGPKQHLCGLGPAHGLGCPTSVTTGMAFNPDAVKRKQDWTCPPGSNETVAWSEGPLSLRCVGVLEISPGSCWVSSPNNTKCTTSQLPAGRTSVSGDRRGEWGKVFRDRDVWWHQNRRSEHPTPSWGSQHLFKNLGFVLCCC